MMEKYFNTAGPGKPSIAYVIDPLTRINLTELEVLIRQQKYFVLHAPRQTGKTSCLLALRDYLNKQGQYYCVYANVEAGQAGRNNVASVVFATIGEIASRLEFTLKSKIGREISKDVRENANPNQALTEFLAQLCSSLDKPLILLLDEIDSLVGDSLISVLRQLRAGYDRRPEEFPQSVILCGVRDVRDYRINVEGKEIITGGSAFNIKAKSLRLSNFTKEEVRRLYEMHTAETGQRFEDGCYDVVWNATEGQPWLVNAMANEVTMEMTENRDRSVTITPEMMLVAQRNIVKTRETHIDALIDKLKEERVRRIIEPMLACSEDIDDSIFPTDDLQYVIDLGIVTEDKPVRISNAIYREVIPRELTWTTQCGLSEQPVWYMNPDNTINTNKLLEDFQKFFRRNADAWIQKFDYREAGPQLLLQAFLQRIVNGSGFIDREYGLGRRRTDLLITKPLREGYGAPKQYILLELKILRGDIEKTIQKGLQQTAEYMDLAGNPELREGHFILFNRKPGVSWDDKIFHRTEQYNGRTIEVWGM